MLQGDRPCTRSCSTSWKATSAVRARRGCVPAPAGAARCRAQPIRAALRRNAAKHGLAEAAPTIAHPPRLAAPELRRRPLLPGGARLVDPRARDGAMPREPGELWVQAQRHAGLLSTRAHRRHPSTPLAGSTPTSRAAIPTARSASDARNSSSAPGSTSSVSRGRAQRIRRSCTLRWSGWRTKEVVAFSTSPRAARGRPSWRCRARRSRLQAACRDTHRRCAAGGCGQCSSIGSPRARCGCRRRAPDSRRLRTIACMRGTGVTTPMR